MIAKGSTVGSRATELREALGESARGMDTLCGVVNRWGRVEKWTTRTVAGLDMRARKGLAALLETLSSLIVDTAHAEALKDYVLHGRGSLPAVTLPVDESEPPRKPSDAVSAAADVYEVVAGVHAHTIEPRAAVSKIVARLWGPHYSQVWSAAA